ncbi:MAG TPA: Hpt domain-containing protein [Roseiarcus sp.]|nr:Hpt domain-containing protein [Roseiarcus sp.]
MRAAAVSNQAFGDVYERADGRPPIDLVHLARATDGDEALESELLAMFDRQSAKLAERLTFADLPRRARADIAHRLRGSALAIGAFRVAQAAAAVEAAFEGQGEAEGVLAALAEAVAQARAAIAALAV